MPDVARFGLIAIIIFLTHFQEGVTGFGCTVLALPFLALLIGLKPAVPVLVLQAWVLTGYIVLISRKDIVWREYALVLGLAGIGFPLGIWMREAVPETTLKWVLAFFMILVGMHGFVRYVTRPKPEVGDGRRKWLSAPLLPIGGFIHGAFGSGGPLAVIYATRALPNKSIFRATLCMVWFTLNTLLVTQFATSARLTPHIWKLTAFCMPFNVLGMVIGNHAHHRMNELLFKRIVYAVLILAGIAIVLSIVLK
jgi:hypothetical protein